MADTIKISQLTSAASTQSTDELPINQSGVTKKASTGLLLGDSLLANSMQDMLTDFVVSGCTWTTISGLSGQMASGPVWRSGVRSTVAAVVSKTFTASKDTYIYLDASNVVQYSEQTNGASFPATPAGYMLTAIVITSGSAITAIYDARKMYNPTLVDFTPTFLGFSGSPTVNYAKQKRMGTTNFVTLGVIGTSNATTKHLILPAVPASWQDGAQAGYAVTGESSSNYTGASVYRTTTYALQVYRGFQGGASGTPFTAWASSGTASFNINILYDIAV